MCITVVPQNQTVIIFNLKVEFVPVFLKKEVQIILKAAC